MTDIFRILGFFVSTSLKCAMLTLTHPHRKSASMGFLLRNFLAKGQGINLTRFSLRVCRDTSLAVFNGVIEDRHMDETDSDRAWKAYSSVAKADRIKALQLDEARRQATSVPKVLREIRDELKQVRTILSRIQHG